MKLVNPLNILDRGYVLVEKEGKIVRELKKLKKGDLIDIRSKDCKREAEIKWGGIWLEGSQEKKEKVLF